jgi:hypothetical protein
MSPSERSGARGKGTYTERSKVPARDAVGAADEAQQRLGRRLELLDEHAAGQLLLLAVDAALRLLGLLCEHLVAELELVGGARLDLPGALLHLADLLARALGTRQRRQCALL